jgi:hypothetical protein
MNGYCAVAFALTGSMTLTMFANHKYMTKFESSLDNSQKKIYDEIKKERLQIFLWATSIAAVIGILLASKNACLSVATALTTQTFVYLLWPKSRYMLEHVKTPEQSALWIQKYKHMSLLGNLGTIVGLMVYMLQGIISS